MMSYARSEEIEVDNRPRTNDLGSGRHRSNPSGDCVRQIPQLSGHHLYSLLRTCALQGVDCYGYLIDVLEKLAAGWPQSRIEELLPEHWAAAAAHSQDLVPA